MMRMVERIEVLDLSYVGYTKGGPEKRGRQRYLKHYA